jgi:hypothetical protein
LEQRWLKLAAAPDISSRGDPFMAFHMTDGARPRLH